MALPTIGPLTAATDDASLLGTLTGGFGNNTLIGDSGEDTVQGGEGDNSQDDSQDDADTSATPPLTAAAFDALGAKSMGAKTIGDAYDQAIANLRAQRTGLSTKEKLSALLAGFGTPTPGGIGNQLSNAARSLLLQKAQANKLDQARQALISKYLADKGVKMTTAADAEAKAAEKSTSGAPNPEEKVRLGYARNYFPNVPDDQIMARNLMYDPKVNTAILGWKQATPMAAAGDVQPSVAPPTFVEFMTKGRELNPGASDADLRALYVHKFGGQ